MNGGMSTILPPDEHTREMAVDYPHLVDSMSGLSTPRQAPPPTPLDGNSTLGANINHTSNLKAVAEVARSIPQPNMDFNRINRLRESINRQRKLQEQNQKIQSMMNENEGAQKLQRLRSGRRSKSGRMKTGIENTGYQDEDADADKYYVEEDIKQMMKSLNQVSQEIADDELIDDIMFVKRLVQDNNFKRALDMHQTLMTSTTSSTNKNLPLCPETLYLKTIGSDVNRELKFCHIKEANELDQILQSPQILALMETHDSVAQTTVQASENMNFLLNMDGGSSQEQQEVLKRCAGLTDKPIRVITINKTSEALGATVKCEGDGRVLIGRIVSGGAAELCGLMREGDEVLEVNGTRVRGMNVDEVGDMVGGMSGEITFALATDPSNADAASTLLAPSVVSSRVKNPDELVVVKHVRALFDYDSFDDAYLPCRELGLSFAKGEILKIMSVEDEDWWQAHKDEDQDNHLSLAGLIPSHQFQHKRETLRQTIQREANQSSGSHDNDEEVPSLFCGPRKNKKKATPPTPDVEEDRVYTYEDMSLYQQPENKKRPIVLVGPPNVGRPELKQRLIENDPHRFALPTHCTTKQMGADEAREMNYEVVSKEQFARMSRSNLFIDQGSFNKELYATSVDSIRRIVQSGKICVLTMNSTALPTLSTLGLMPYIVFVCPPALDKLRINMARERRQLKEDELREIIDGARQMESDYAQYFDHTIRCTDLDISYAELLRLINKLDSEPQWVPTGWLD